MLVHPWDSASDPEWRDWLADGRVFGQLVAVDGDCQPVITPVPFHFDGDATVRLHLARPNPIWPALELRHEAVLTVLDDYAQIPGDWRAAPDRPASHGVPTSYYATVQLAGRLEIVDDRAELAELLRRQLDGLGMAEELAPVRAGEPPYGRLLTGIRGVLLHVQRVSAKFKYDDQKTAPVRAELADRLAERGRRGDRRAREQQLRRLDQSAVDSPATGSTR